jgi:predicted alpha/beta hydrolase family esterase
MSGTRIMIIPGNGCTPVEQCNWYAWLRDELEVKGFNVFLKNMPDPYKARQTIWLKFIEEEFKCDESCVLIGHSSGAEAAMRYAEGKKVAGIVLVSACHTDLGLASEAVSGYYDHPWEWEKICANCGWILQLGSSDDPFIPMESEQRVVAEQLKADFREFDDQGHFMVDESPEILCAVMEKLVK